MKHRVTLVLSIYQTIEVEAASIKEAEQLAWKQADQARLLTDYTRGEGALRAEYEIYDSKEVK